MVEVVRNVCWYSSFVMFSLRSISMERGGRQSYSDFLNFNSSLVSLRRLCYWVCNWQPCRTVQRRWRLDNDHLMVRRCVSVQLWMGWYCVCRPSPWVVTWPLHFVLFEDHQHTVPSSPSSSISVCTSNQGWWMQLEHKNWWPCKTMLEMEMVKVDQNKMNQCVPCAGCSDMLYRLLEYKDDHGCPGYVPPCFW